MRENSDVAVPTTGSWPGFEDFVASQWTSLVGLAVLLTHDRGNAPDLVQDVLAGMLRRWESINEPKSYAAASVRNAARRNGRRRLDLAVVLSANSEAVDETAQTTIDVQRALSLLSPVQYETVVLRYYVGLSDREIAATLRRRPGTVKSQLNRALARLRKELGS